MVDAIAVLILFGSGFLLGAIVLYVIMVARIHRNLVENGGDKSNVGNAQHVLHHVVLHPEDFGMMYYLTDEQVETLWHATGDIYMQRPFWYVYEDLFKGILKTRPKGKNKNNDRDPTGPRSKP